MDKAWLEVIRITGAVGVVAFLVYLVLGYIYSDKVIDLFGSDKMFLLSVGIVASVLVILLVAILKQKEKSATPDEQGAIEEKVSTATTESPKVTYQDKATHNGDNNF